MKLYIDDNGRCTCAAHAGEYLSASIKTHPHRAFHDTPLGVWEAFNTNDIRLFGSDIDCEKCQAA